MVVEQLDIKGKRNLKLNLILSTKKNNSKGITDLKVKCEAINLLEENVKESLCDLGLGKEFLDIMMYERCKK